MVWFQSLLCLNYYLLAAINAEMSKKEDAAVADIPPVVPIKAVAPSVFQSAKVLARTVSSEPSNGNYDSNANNVSLLASTPVEIFNVENVATEIKPTPPTSVTLSGSTSALQQQMKRYELART